MSEFELKFNELSKAALDAIKASEQELTESEQAIFIAGFLECFKYLDLTKQLKE